MKIEVLDSTLSGGLRGTVCASGCGDCRDRGIRSRHSSTNVGGTDITSAGVPFANDSTALGPLSSDMTCSCVDFSTPLGVSDNGNPCRGLSKEVSGVRRRSIGNEQEDDCVGVRIPPKMPGACRVAGPIASTSASCGNSVLENNESEVNIEVISATLGEGTGSDGGGCSSNRVCTFRMRSSMTSFSEGISWKK